MSSSVPSDSAFGMSIVVLNYDSYNREEGSRSKADFDQVS